MSILMGFSSTTKHHCAVAHALASSSSSSWNKQKTSHHQVDHRRRRPPSTPHNHQERRQFLQNQAIVALGGAFILPQDIPTAWAFNDDTTTSMTMTTFSNPIALQFLPRAGCWAVPVTLLSSQAETSYLAVVDTGSPFLTAPPVPKVWGVVDIIDDLDLDYESKPERGRFALFFSNQKQRDTSSSSSSKTKNSNQLQYGDTLSDDITWVHCRSVSLGRGGDGSVQQDDDKGFVFETMRSSDKDRKNKDQGGFLKWRQGFKDNNNNNNQGFRLAISTPELMEATGGIFLGLMPHDDLEQPGAAVLEQYYAEVSFALDDENDARRTPETTRITGFVLDCSARTLQFLLTTTTTNSVGRIENVRDDGETSSSSPLLTTRWWDNNNNNKLRTTRKATPPPVLLDLYDLSPYGPNLYHYAVPCRELVLELSLNANRDKKRQLQKVNLSKLNRPVVVIDTGLTGCIFSDSWFEEQDALGVFFGSSSSSLMEDGTPRPTIAGLRLGLGNDKDKSTTVLKSNSTYWYLSCFRLPWFFDEQNHPHIIAAGATFLQHAQIAVDTERRQMALMTG